MTAVRPPIFPPQHVPAAGARADLTKAAAQKAFFDLAMGRALAPQAAPAALAAAPPTAPATLVRMPDAAAEKPEKILRPGSLLDIRV